MSASDMFFVWVIWSVSLPLWLSNDRIEEVRLKDGTRCVTYQTTIQCDWTKP